MMDYHVRSKLCRHGADAHHPTKVAADFDAAIATLRQVGYQLCVGYEKRKPFVVNL